MENSRQVKGLLNTTLKGIRHVTGEYADETTARHIMRGIHNAIKDKNVKADFVDYCMEEYTIQI